ncbi:sugar phosphate isomerase/epimerase family protein [Arcticibacterium luteifluviistationis]|uniref:Xylose isomerase n=1 Tax=Arcticibacterium luteifluviistationis TaxID=1784714 RepID=A0A2Z4G8S3_9BACT|nr:TIM barrel protein [Arcticibacterium luteifluviistationis]AWV97556.1 xylose isomerase [Arcticibacterium luteifluviistationis]
MKTSLNRRSFIKSTALAATAAALPSLSSFNVAPNLVGISVASYHLRFRDGGSTAHPTWNGALPMTKHLSELGVGGGQIGVRNWDTNYIKQIRDLKESSGMWLEGQIRMPKTESDLVEFETNVKAAKEAGIEIVRVACLSGRRYVNFQTIEEWNTFKKESLKSIRLAEPVMRRHKMKLAIENHKDWTADELVKILKDYDSEYLGCNLDTGNNISFMENPYDVVEKLAPYTMTTHFKDMGIEEYEDGFLLSEVPFGTGFLDLNKMAMTIRRHNPSVKFNLEMMTRDPLPIPFLTDQYWATFGNTTGKDVAKSVKLLRENYNDKPLTRTTRKTFHQQLALEEANQIACLDFARKELGLM